jgi:hypothetical protein
MEIKRILAILLALLMLHKYGIHFLPSTTKPLIVSMSPSSSSAVTATTTTTRAPSARCTTKHSAKVAAHARIACLHAKKLFNLKREIAYEAAAIAAFKECHDVG